MIFHQAGPSPEWSFIKAAFWRVFFLQDSQGGLFVMAVAHQDGLPLKRSFVHGPEVKRHLSILTATINPMLSLSRCCWTMPVMRVCSSTRSRFSSWVATCTCVGKSCKFMISRMRLLVKHFSGERPIRYLLLFLKPFPSRTMGTKPWPRTTTLQFHEPTKCQ